jgi:hypothetical protein
MDQSVGVGRIGELARGRGRNQPTSTIFFRPEANGHCLYVVTYHIQANAVLEKSLRSDNDLIEASRRV